MFTKQLLVPADLAHAAPPRFAFAHAKHAPRAESAQQDIHARAVVWGSRDARQRPMPGSAWICQCGPGGLLRGVADRPRAPDLDQRSAPGELPGEHRRSRVMLLLLALVVMLPCCLLGMAMLMWWDPPLSAEGRQVHEQNSTTSGSLARPPTCRSRRCSPAPEIPRTRRAGRRPSFAIIERASSRAGAISLRLGDGQTLLAYAGHLGYRIDELFRGHHYAERACRPARAPGARMASPS